MAAAVCICLQSACECGAVDEPRLLALASAADLKVRKVATAAADLMVCKTGSTLAFMLWRPQGAGSGGGGDAYMRITRLAAAFSKAYVLIPHEFLGTPAALDAIARFGCEESLSFVFMPMGAEFAERALALAAALLPAEAAEVQWCKQQEQMAASSEAVTHVLLALPLPADGEAAHHANMLRTLGSLQDISQRSADEIVSHTDMGSQEAASIAAFFQRGARHPEPPGLHRGGPRLQSL